MLSNIFKIAAPMTLANLINILYSVVDRMYIGHMPGNGLMALTGIGLAAPITIIISAFSGLCSQGGAPLCSIARGAKDEKRAQRIMGNSFSLLLFLAVILTAAGYIVKEPVLWLTGASNETFGYANDYLSIYLAGTVFVMVSLGMNPFVNSQGFAKIGMLTVLLGAVVNILLDPIFIFMLDMGVKGAALATVIAQACSAVWVFRFLISKKAIIRITVPSMKPDFKILRESVTLGITGFVAMGTNSLVSLVCNTRLAALGGDLYITSMTVINSIREILHTPLMGMSGGAQPVISFNYGAKEYGRVKQGIKIMTVLCVGWSILIWIFIMIMPELFIGIFNNDAILKELAAPLVRIFYCMIVFMAFQSAGQATFNALGKAKHAIFFSLFRKVLIVVPMMYLLPNIFGLGVNGVFWAEPVSDVIGGCLCYTTMLLTAWRELTRGEQERLAVSEESLV